MAAIELTDEQELVASSRAKNLVVNAYAGTGKTSVLVEYAKRRPNERMMYLAFNRSIKEEAALKFPKNVRCVTTHGLAFPQFGVRYQAKLGNPKASHLSRALDLDVLSAGRVLAVITNFLISTEATITEEHAIPVMPKANMNIICNLVDYAQRGWELMKDPANAAVPMPHDGYLKLYQLSKPTINTGIVLFDESQDANPVTLDFVMNQRCNKVFVGDRFQSIYQFRGAVDALSKIRADENLYLTTSFRFGDGVAALASALLKDWCHASKPVRGKGQYATTFKVNQGAPHAVIARTNGRLFAEAVMLVRSDMPFGFAGGVEGYRFDQILDAYRLFASRRGEMRDQFLASFDDFGQMRQYAEELDDKEVKALVNVVEEYRHEIPSLIEEIKSRAVPKLTGEEVTLSTAHKSKGLEWMDVVLTDDYTDLQLKRDDETGELVGPKPEEVNILYVAATRAMRGLCLPATVRDWLVESGRAQLLQACQHEPSAVAIASAPSEPAAPTPHQIPASKVTMELARRFKLLDAQIAELHGIITSSAPDMASGVASYLREKASKFAPAPALPNNGEANPTEGEASHV